MPLWVRTGIGNPYEMGGCEVVTCPPPFLTIEQNQHIFGGGEARKDRDKKKKKKKQYEPNT
jgi:hypothetical protein